MKYSEFKQRVVGIGFNVEDEAREVWVVDDEGDIVATVSTDITSSMDTGYTAFKEQGEDVRREILDLNYKLSKTPLAEREEEKRYWLQRIEPPILGEQCPRYLFYTRVGGYYDIGTTKSEWRNVIKTIFTESEIAKMDITGFQKVEVTPE